jgi:hypothetical protein
LSWFPLDTADIIAEKLSKNAPKTSGQVTVKTQSWSSKDGIIKRDEKTSQWGGTSSKPIKKSLGAIASLGLGRLVFLLTFWYVLPVSNGLFSFVKCSFITNFRVLSKYVTLVVGEQVVTNIIDTCQLSTDYISGNTFLSTFLGKKPQMLPTFILF